MEASLTPPINHIQSLTMVLTDSGPEEKFCIVRLYQLYSEAWFTLPSINEIAKATGVSYTQAKQAIDQLKAYGLLIRRDEIPGQDIPTDEIGLLLPEVFTPPREAALSKKRRAKINNQPIMLPSPTKPTLHQNLIEAALGDEINDLRTGNKLLMATLLRYANETGAVRNLGMADLGSLLGMSKDRVSSQIEKLKNLGYIRTSFGGVTGKYMFGIQNGALFMNLKHPKYGRRRKNGVTVILQGPFNEIMPIKCMARNFSHAAKTLPSVWSMQSPACATTYKLQTDSIPYISKEFTPDQLSRISGFFKDQVSTGVIDYYQKKLEEYASCILSKQFPEPGSLKKPAEQLISERILEEVIPLKYRKTYQNDYKYMPAAYAKDIIEATAGLANHMAIFISQWLTHHTQVDWHQMNIEILPASRVQTIGHGAPDTITVECTFKNQIYADLGYWVISKAHDCSYSTHKVDDLTATSLAFQIQNGLRESHKESRPFPIKEKSSSTSQKYQSRTP